MADIKSKAKAQLLMYKDILVVASDSKELFEKLKTQLNLEDGEYKRFIDEFIPQIKWISIVDGYKIIVDDNKDDIIRDIATVHLDYQKELMRVFEKYKID